MSPTNCNVCGHDRRGVTGCGNIDCPWTENPVSKLPEANDRQIGGEHYKTAFEHWDLVERNGLGYLEGCATKYVSRWRKKNGVQDLQKALHYIDKLIEMERDHDRLPRGLVPCAELDRFCTVNGLNAGMLERNVMYLLCRWCMPRELHEARAGVVELIDLANAT